MATDSVLSIYFPFLQLWFGFSCRADHAGGCGHPDKPQLLFRKSTWSLSRRRRPCLCSWWEGVWALSLSLGCKLFLPQGWGWRTGYLRPDQEWLNTCLWCWQHDSPFSLAWVEPCIGFLIKIPLHGAIKLDGEGEGQAFSWARGKAGPPGPSMLLCALGQHYQPGAKWGKPATALFHFSIFWERTKWGP